MTRAWVVLILLFLCPLARAQYVVQGKDADIAAKYLKTRKTNLSASELNLILKALVKSENVESARIVQAGSAVRFDVKTTGTNQKVTFKGNQALTEAEIAATLGLDRMSRISKEDLQRALPKLREKYESIGLRTVDISLQETISGDTNEYIVEINEGRSAVLEDVIVLSADKHLNTAIRYHLGRFRGQMIDKALLKDLETRTNKFLVDSRMLGAKISKISPIYNQERTTAKITVSLEGIESYEFIFDGNRYFSSGNIISHFNLEENYLNYIKNSNLLIKDVESLYLEHGFANVSVNTETIKYENQKKIVVLFHIKEGPQIRIKNILVTGKITRFPSYYESMIRDNLSQMSNSNLYIKDNLNRAIAKVAIDLKDQGYLKAEAIPLNYKINEDATATISVQINENMLTQIRSIQFVGIQSFTSNQLYDVIDLKPNSTLNLIKVYESFMKLRTFYQKNGYLEFQILTPPENLVRYIDNYEFADLKYEVKEGPQIVIKDVQTSGNTFTKDKVILRELDLKPGMVLTSDLVNDSVVFLERTQLFSRAQLLTSDTNTDVRERSVMVEVQEKNPGLFSSGVGVSNDRNITLRGNVGVSYQNLAGTGRGVSARGDLRYSLDPSIQYPENRLVLGYYEPYVFFNRLRGRVSLVREQFIFSLNPDTKSVTIQENNELNFLLEKQISRQFKFLWNTWNLSSLATYDKETPDNQDRIQIGSLGPAIEWDRRDDTFVPRDGTFTNAALEYSSPMLGSTSDLFNHIEFFRATAGHIFYTPLTPAKTWVLVNDFRLGFLDNLSDKPQSGVPATKLFYLGGRSTLRGYDLRREERVPSLLEICRATGQVCDSINDFQVRTKSHFYLIKTEVRFPLYKDVGGSFFYDGGAVFIKGIDIEDHYRDTAGFGLRYVTPIGALTAELGFKLDKKTISPTHREERPYTIHISIGSF